MKIIKICTLFAPNPLHPTPKSFNLNGMHFNWFLIAHELNAFGGGGRQGKCRVWSESDSGSIIGDDLRIFNATSAPHRLKHYTSLWEIIAPIQREVKRFHVLAMIIFIELVKWISFSISLFFGSNFASPGIDLTLLFSFFFASVYVHWKKIDFSLMNRRGKCLH